MSKTYSFVDNLGVAPLELKFFWDDGLQMDLMGGRELGCLNQLPAPEPQYSSRKDSEIMGTL